MKEIKLRKVGITFMKKEAFNPYLPSWEYIPDGEPYVFNGRVYVYGSHDFYNGYVFCMGDYVCWSAPVDDLGNWQYMLSYEFVDRATEVGYTKFTELAQHAMEVLRYSESMRDDCKMIFLTHSENVGDAMNPKYSIKTIGKLLAEKVTLEGLFTYVFFTKVQEGDSGRMEYKFLTNTDGECVAKTPMGMFDDLLIDNDLNEIIKVIDAYNNDEE